MHDQAFAEAFTAAMDCRGRMLAPTLAAAIDCRSARRLLDDDKSGPLWAAEYSVLPSTITRGRLYSAAEIAGWLADLDFGIIARGPTALGRSLLVAAPRRP